MRVAEVGEEEEEEERRVQSLVHPKLEQGGN